MHVLVVDGCVIVVTRSHTCMHSLEERHQYSQRETTSHEEVTCYAKPRGQIIGCVPCYLFNWKLVLFRAVFMALLIIMLCLQKNLSIYGRLGY